MAWGKTRLLMVCGMVIFIPQQSYSACGSNLFVYTTILEITGWLEMSGPSNRVHESCGDRLRSGDGRPYNHGVRPEAECAADFFRVHDMSLHEKWNAQLFDQRFRHCPVYRSCARGLRGKAVESGCHGVGAAGFGRERLLLGCDVSEHWLVQLGMNACDELRPGL